MRYLLLILHNGLLFISHLLGALLLTLWTKHVCSIRLLKGIFNAGSVAGLAVRHRETRSLRHHRVTLIVTRSKVRKVNNSRVS